MLIECPNCGRTAYLIINEVDGSISGTCPCSEWTDGV